MMNWQKLGPQVPGGGNGLTRFIGRTAMRLSGWRLLGEFPDRPKVIVAVAPHTSNFDFVLTAMVIWSLGLRASYLAKRSLFRFPLGVVMRYFGGIPVDRSAPQGLVEQMTARFQAAPQLVLGITPEGTRGSVSRWKLGFALIAQSAEVPVLPAIINYRKRIVEFHPLIDKLDDRNETLATLQSAAATGAPRRTH